MADNVLGNAGSGAMKGATLGAQLGTNPLLMAATGGLSAAIAPLAGAAIGGIGGGVKANQNKKKKEEALGFTPGYQDPTQVQRLAEIDQIAKNIQAGTDAATQTAIGQAEQTTGATQNRLARVTGGNTGATVDALIKAQRAGGDASNTAIAQAQTRLPFFKDLGQQLANRVEQRKFDLGMLNRGQNLAEWAQADKEGNINRNSIIASGIGQNELGKATEGMGGGQGAEGADGTGALGRIGTLLNGLKLGQGGGTPEGIPGLSPEVMQGLNAFQSMPI